MKFLIYKTLIKMMMNGLWTE